LRETKRSIRHYQADINADERPTPPENEAHKSTDARVALDPGPIIDPDNREVLHIMKHLEKRDAHEDVLDAVIAVPPEADTGNQQRQFDWTEATARPPVAPLTPQEHHRH
jgi:hypothetical protein